MGIKIWKPNRENIKIYRKIICLFTPLTYPGAEYLPTLPAAHICLFRETTLVAVARNTSPQKKVLKGFNFCLLHVKGIQEIGC